MLSCKLLLQFWGDLPTNEALVHLGFCLNLATNLSSVCYYEANANGEDRWNVD
jgi:hypothetical protein